jgi:predicted PurR-regulated permease PerM
VIFTLRGSHRLRRGVGAKVSRVSGVSGVCEVSEVSELAEVFEASEVSEVSEVSGVSEVWEAPEEPEVPGVTGVDEDPAVVSTGGGIGGGRCSGSPCSAWLISFMLSRRHPDKAPFDRYNLPSWYPMPDEAPEAPETWRSRFSGSASRRGVPLATIVVTAAVVIGLLDLNAALIIGLWSLRTIVVYVIVAFFITLLLTPATRFLNRRVGMTHGGATLAVWLVGAVLFIGLLYLFTEPLITAATHFGKQIPVLVKEAKKGHGLLGRIVYQFHLQKYLSESSAKLTSQLTKVLKPATALSVGAAAVSTIVTIATIAILTFFSMLEAPRLWHGFLSVFKPATGERIGRVVDETISTVTGYMLGNFLTSVIAGIVVGVTLTILGVPFALLLAVFVGLVDLLPLVGGLLAGVPVVIIAAIHSVPAGIVMLIVFLVYQQIENHVLNPVIIGRTVRLNPFWVLLSVLIAASLGGRVAGGLGSFVGALIGIPIGGAVQVIVRELRRGPEAAGAPPEGPKVEEPVGVGSPTT